VRADPSWKALAGLILVAVIIIGVAAIVYMVKPPTAPPDTPTVAFDGWYDEKGSRIWKAAVGQKVTLKLKVQASPIGSMGVLTVEVRKDIPFAPDKTAETRSFQLNLLPLQTETLQVTFTVDEYCREYFYRVAWKGIWIYDPTTPGARNGLGVLKPEEAVEYVGTEFEA
jgi:hypothetical protein